jgi:hypothetical protein
MLIAINILNYRLEKQMLPLMVESSEPEINSLLDTIKALTSPEWPVRVFLSSKLFVSQIFIV